MQEEQYRYYKAETRGLDQEGLLEDLSKGKAGDVVLLHACAHNPTGEAPLNIHLPVLLAHLMLCGCLHLFIWQPTLCCIQHAGFRD